MLLTEGGRGVTLFSMLTSRQILVLVINWTFTRTNFIRVRGGGGEEGGGDAERKSTSDLLDTTRKNGRCCERSVTVAHSEHRFPAPSSKGRMS